eukprot:scaffold7354_cov95-Amphora_coffeaeformis.AAC.4
MEESATRPPNNIATTSCSSRKVDHYPGTESSIMPLDLAERPTHRIAAELVCLFVGYYHCRAAAVAAADDDKYWRTQRRKHNA